MRIAYLSGAYIPSRGANSMHVMGMCEAMAQLGHDVTLYARPGEPVCRDDFEFYGVEPIFTLSKQSRPQVKAWGALVNAIRTRRAMAKGGDFDLIYARETWALSLITSLGIPFLYESHWQPWSAIQRAAEVRLLRHPRLSRVVFISEALQQMYRDSFPWMDASRTLVAHDAANLVDLMQESSVARHGRSAALQVGYVGSFQVGCGMNMIAKTSVLLPEYDFHVFGGSPREVRAWTERTSDISNLHFRGFVPPGELPAVYSGLDVMLAPYQAATRSIQWASPMKIFEYMAHGRAIVCSDFPVLREVLEQEVTALLVQPDRPEEWTRALQRLGADELLRRRLGGAGYESLKRNFTWRSRAERILDGLQVN